MTKDANHRSETPVASEEPVVLSLRDLTVSVRNQSGLVPLINDISFDLRRGETLAIAGESGSGKSITSLAIMGLLPTRAGVIEFEGNRVTSFKEKPQLHTGWINGGYFVVEPAFFDFIDGDETMLEREPLERAVAAGELMAYFHEGFWHCMDTKRDHEMLEALWLQGAPWAQ